jgi:hypothetical protein
LTFRFTSADIVFASWSAAGPTVGNTDAAAMHAAQRIELAAAGVLAQIIVIPFSEAAQTTAYGFAEKIP